MKLKEFLEKFLPDFEQKKIIVIADFGYKCPLTEKENALVYLGLLTRYLSEIQQNFADKICEKQRGNCAAEAKTQRDYLPDSDRLQYNVDVNSICNAKQPKIEEL